jgi:nucleotide-binding universal stress UspA family protein
MFDKILYPVDMEEPDFSKHALEVAIEQCRIHESELHVLTVIPGYNMPMVASFFPDGTMDKAKKGMAQKLDEWVKKNVPDDVPVFSHVAVGRPYKEILLCRRGLDADLIVLQSHNDKYDHFLGSVAAKVVEQARVSVMVIRS